MFSFWGQNQTFCFSYWIDVLSQNGQFHILFLQIRMYIHILKYFNYFKYFIWFWVFLIYENKMLLFYSVCWCCLCVSSFGEFPVFSVSCLIHDFYANIPDFYANILCGLVFFVLYRAWCAVGGVPVWLGGICSLVHVFTWACILTCQPDSQFRIPVRILLLQGTGGRAPRIIRE